MFLNGQGAILQPGTGWLPRQGLQADQEKEPESKTCLCKHKSNKAGPKGLPSPEIFAFSYSSPNSLPVTGSVPLSKVSSVTALPTLCGHDLHVCLRPIETSSSGKAGTEHSLFTIALPCLVWCFVHSEGRVFVQNDYASSTPTGDDSCKLSPFNTTMSETTPTPKLVKSSNEKISWS